MLNEANGSFQLRVQAWYAHVFFFGGKAEHKKKHHLREVGIRVGEFVG